MKLIIHTPEMGDWTVVQDEDGYEIYSGHDSFNQLAQAIAERFYGEHEIEHIVYTDEAFEEKF